MADVEPCAYREGLGTSGPCTEPGDYPAWWLRKMKAEGTQEETK